MPTNARYKKICAGLLECVAVASLFFVFLSGIISSDIFSISNRPHGMDSWFFCYQLQLLISKIVSFQPGNLWDGGFFFPFHETSLLFVEPAWGTAFLLAPVWFFTKNIFPIVAVGGISFLFLSWIFTFYFIRSLGGARLYSLFSTALFCMSGSMLSLLYHMAFWPFFLIPLLGIITVKIFTSTRLLWGILWGVTFGFLAWSSAHLFLMGGSFLLCLVLWNVLFNRPTKKTFITLLAAFTLSGLIASALFIPMSLAWKNFNFTRTYEEPVMFACNWANLIYRGWPLLQFNLLPKTPLWEYLRTHSNEQATVGMPIFLLISCIIIFITRLTNVTPFKKTCETSRWLAFFAIAITCGLWAFLSLWSLKEKSLQSGLPLPVLASGTTYVCYMLSGGLLFIMRHRINTAAKHIDFFLLLIAIFFGFLMFGPYYITGNKNIVASPVAFLIYQVPGFSAIRVPSRWGTVFSFTLCVAVALFLSQNTNRKIKICLSSFIFLALLETIPFLQMPDTRNLSPYKWTPREIDVFLKSLPGNGAVLELESYPIDLFNTDSNNSLNYSLFSRLYHKKPIVVGYASFFPPFIARQLLSASDKLWSPRTIRFLRKFGAQYWVFHTENWPPEDIRSIAESKLSLKLIKQLDNGKTLVFENPSPRVSIAQSDECENLNATGLKLIGEDKFDAASIAFEKARSLDPDDAYPYFGLGMCLSTRGQLDEALASLKKAIEIDPSDAGFYENRAGIYAKRKQYAEAWEDVRAATQLGRKMNPDFIKDLEQASGRKA